MSRFCVYGERERERERERETASTGNRLSTHLYKT